MLEGIEQVSRWTVLKIAAVRKLMEETSRHVRTHLPQVYSHELMQVLFEQPYCRIGSLVERGIVKRQTASVYLKQLVDIGVLVEESAGKEKLFVHTKLVRLMSVDSNEITPCSTWMRSSPDRKLPSMTSLAGPSAYPGTCMAMGRSASL